VLQQTVQCESVIATVFFFNLCGGTLGTVATAPGDSDGGETGGMTIGRGNQSTQRKPAPAPLCPPQIPHD
jgi:hypothetical protein